MEKRPGVPWLYQNISGRIQPSLHIKATETTSNFFDYYLSCCQASVLFTGCGQCQDEEQKNCGVIEVSTQISKELLGGQAMDSRVRIPMGKPLEGRQNRWSSEDGFNPSFYLDILLGSWQKQSLQTLYTDHPYPPLLVFTWVRMCISSLLSSGRCHLYSWQISSPQNCTHW